MPYLQHAQHAADSIWTPRTNAIFLPLIVRLQRFRSKARCMPARLCNGCSPLSHYPEPRTGQTRSQRGRTPSGHSRTLSRQSLLGGARPGGAAQASTGLAGQEKAGACYRLLQAAQPHARHPNNPQQKRTAAAGPISLLRLQLKVEIQAPPLVRQHLVRLACSQRSAAQRERSEQLMVASSTC